MSTYTVIVAYEDEQGQIDTQWVTLDAETQEEAEARALAFVPSSTKVVRVF